MGVTRTAGEGSVGNQATKGGGQLGSSRPKREDSLGGRDLQWREVGGTHACRKGSWEVSGLPGGQLKGNRLAG